MKKVKWIVLNNRFTLDETIEKLKKDPYTEEKGKGFIFEKIRDDFLQGRFVEKIITEEKVGSLYGETTTIERIDYRNTSFSIASQFLPIIAIINPPRTLKPFAQAIVKNIGLGVSLEEIEVNPFDWFEPLSQNLSLTITQLDISQVKVAEFALAKMQINSSHDLKQYFLKELKDKDSRLERLTSLINDPDRQGKLKLFRNGMAHIESKGETDLINLLQICLMVAR
ncbi:TPA: hypothetical protein L9M72_000423 [Klebsiella quasipneumoniae subsp. quasipneumoniae]|nr:hypothetical protein [Klebsiella quasipneumoniae subsp. quasipneumoniae]HBR2083108.1 hypothetical protein [Klebsiella quasipneumoniae subsp. quasipneumoniae]